MATPSTALHQPHLSLLASHHLSPADAVWIGTALLHYRYPERESFSCTDIVSHVIERRLTAATERLVVQYVERLVVSNRMQEVATECASMLFALPDGSRRLYRSLDHAEQDRWGAPVHAVWETVPPEFAFLQRWYELWNEASINASPDPLLRLVGSGKDIWADEHADEYVARLREGWEHHP